METGCEVWSVNWINLAHSNVHWWVLANILAGSEAINAVPVLHLHPCEGVTRCYDMMQTAIQTVTNVQQVIVKALN
jgi:hypothetical protein